MISVRVRRLEVHSLGQGNFNVPPGVLNFHYCIPVCSCEAKNLIREVIKNHRRKYQRENSDDRRVICRELTRWPAARGGIVIAKTCFYEKCGARIWHA